MNLAANLLENLISEDGTMPTAQNMHTPVCLQTAHLLAKTGYAAAAERARSADPEESYQGRKELIALALYGRDPEAAKAIDNLSMRGLKIRR